MDIILQKRLQSAARIYIAQQLSLAALSDCVEDLTQGWQVPVVFEDWKNEWESDMQRLNAPRTNVALAFRVYILDHLGTLVSGFA